MKPQDMEGVPLSRLEAKSYDRVYQFSNILENREIIILNDYIFKTENFDCFHHRIKWSFTSNTHNSTELFLLLGLKQRITLNLY